LQFEIDLMAQGRNSRRSPRGDIKESDSIAYRREEGGGGGM